MDAQSLEGLLSKSSRQSLDASQIVSKAESLFASGDLQGAEALARKALWAEPDHPGAHVLLGFIAANRGADGAAREHLQLAVESDGSLWGPRTALAALYEKAGRNDMAARYWREALALKPGDPEALFHLGMCHGRQGELWDANAFLQLAVGFGAKRPDQLYQLAQLLDQLDRVDPAIEMYERVLAMAPNFGDAVARLAHLREKERSNTVRTEPSPVTPEGQLRLARAFDESGNTAEAEQRFRQLLENFPDFPDGLVQFGSFLQGKGAFVEAETYLLRAMELIPGWAELYVLYFTGKKAEPKDRPILERLEELISKGAFTDQEMGDLHGALGKAHDDLAQYEAAMRHFNARGRHLLIRDRERYGPFDEERFRAQIERLIELYDRTTIAEKAAEMRAGSPVPIFIVGMMRSGTTLTEQLLSKHPDIGDAGELRYWAKAVEALPSLEVPDTGIRQDLADRFRDVLRSHAKDCRMVTDKQPENYLLLGPILCALPDAKIIHCRRNPVDTALSIFITNMKATTWTRDKASIVRVYKQYLRLMEHWRAVLDASQLLEVDYEELVSDSETVVNRMFAFCGIEPGAESVADARGKDTIRTPSLWQARQPIYKTSRERWRNYEPWLDELAELLSLSEASGRS